jgi:hypothetical protein
MNWSKEQLKELKELCYKNTPNAALAAHFGVPPTEIYAKRSQLGITRAKCADKTGAVQPDTATKKKRFVEGPLSKLLHDANSDITGAYYTNTSIGNEDVEIRMKSGAKYHISVTADSLMSTAYAVINFIKAK